MLQILGREEKREMAAAITFNNCGLNFCIQQVLL